MSGMGKVSRRRASVSMNTIFSFDEQDALQALLSTPANKVHDDTSRVQVAVRVRPLNSNDKAVEATKSLICSNGTIHVLNSSAPLKALQSEQNKEHNIEHTFNYDYAFDSSCAVNSNQFSSQKNIFNGLGIPIVLNACQGYNASIFAYGQTGSGKSHTMMGSADQPGMIPHVSSALFVMIEKMFEEGHSVTIEGSYLEIYQERIFDLLGNDYDNSSSMKKKNNGKASAASGSQPLGLKLREDVKTGIFVEGLSSHPVAGYSDVASLIENGLHKRTVAATNMNLESSRSHSVFTLEVSQLEPGSGADAHVRKSKISLIDLAGSERVERTGATGQRLKEGQIINRSLLTLGRCITALAKKPSKKENSKKTTAPFRESTLTLLLRESLMGNSKTVIVATVSPSSRDVLESTSTLRFAATCKELKTKARVNDVSLSAEVDKLRSEVERLKAELSAAQTGGDDGKKGRLNFLEAKLHTLSSADLKPQEIRRVWAEAVAEQQRKRIENDFQSEEDASSSPYLYNLDQDPQMQGKLPLVLPTRDVSVGRSDSETLQDLQLNGLGIAREHCLIKAVGESRLLHTFRGATCYVNGTMLTPGSDTELHHGDRIVLGSCTMVFILVVPSQCLDVALIDEMTTYWDALQEIFANGRKGQGGAKLAHGGSDDDLLDGLGEDDDDDLLSGIRNSENHNELHDFEKHLVRVQKDVLQANTIGLTIGLTFEAHIAVGPLPVGSAAVHAHKSEVLGMIPAANISFRVRAWFEHQEEEQVLKELEDLADTAGAIESKQRSKARVVLIDCDYDDFADLSQPLIGAYQDVSSITRGLEGEEENRVDQSHTFYCQIFTGMDTDGSGLISYSELKEGMAQMELEISDGELEAQFQASGESELDVFAIQQLLSRHLKLKFGEILESVYDADAFALFLRDDLERAAHHQPQEEDNKKDDKDRGLDKTTASAIASSLVGVHSSSQLNQVGVPSSSQLNPLEQITLLKATIAENDEKLSSLANKRARVAEKLNSLSEVGTTMESFDTTMAGGGRPGALLRQSTVSMQPLDLSGDIIHEGWLRKKATQMPYNWQKAWFVLKKNGREILIHKSIFLGLLIYYDKPNGTMKGSLDLNAGLVVGTSQESLSAVSSAIKFTVTAAVRKELVVEALNPRDQESWVKHLTAESARQSRRREAADMEEALMNSF